MNTARNKSTVSASHTAVIRTRPTILLMIGRLRASAANLEQALTIVKQRYHDTAMRLARLGAQAVEQGEPHLDDRADPDPMARVRAAVISRHRQPLNDALPDQPGVNITLTGKWDISTLSVEETLILVDQLRFDAAADVDIKSKPAPIATWQNPEAQIRDMMAKLSAPPPIDLSPQFLYIARPSDEQLSKATSEAYAAAEKLANRLANAAGRTVAELASINLTQSQSETRPDRIMERQRCAALLESSTFQMTESDCVSEDARMVDLKITVHTTFYLD